MTDADLLALRAFSRVQSHSLGSKIDIRRIAYRWRANKTEDSRPYKRNRSAMLATAPEK